MHMLESLRNVELLKSRHKLLKMMMAVPTKPNYFINSSEPLFIKHQISNYSFIVMICTSLIS